MPVTLALPTPLWYQTPVINALNDKKHRYVIANFSRRIGKSLIAKGQTIIWALERKTKIGYVLPTGGLCRKFIREICTELSGTGVITASNTMDKYIQFANGSVVYFHALEEFSRGSGGYKKMIFDECAFLDEQVYRSVYEPLTLEADKIYMCSTPNGQAGVFFDYYNKGLTPSGTYISFSCTLEESGLYEQSIIDEIKDTTPRMVFEQEYCCKFLSGGISCFTNYEKRLIKEPAQRTKHLYAGIDFSGANGGIDSTILTIVNDKGEMVLLKAWRNGSIETLNEITDILELYDVRMCWAEENAAGAISIQMMKKRFKRITPFQTTNDSKRYIVEQVIRMFEKGEGAIIDNPATRIQFGSMIMDFTKTGKVTYHNLNAAIHDDIPMAYCMAVGCQCQYERKTTRILT